MKIVSIEKNGEFEKVVFGFNVNGNCYLRHKSGDWIFINHNYGQVIKVDNVTGIESAYQDYVNNRSEQKEVAKSIVENLNYPNLAVPRFSLYGSKICFHDECIGRIFGPGLENMIKEYFERFV